ncbi:MAG: PBP1A family penicillin-binding protein [Hydrogenibacillus schlegelii]|uniref:PBP1A family penicillin-binding protein n=1 Tax=Hydrogenibacillus schlegelii TaxID=1484 RepID=A0A947CYF3_HYDSH|nr:PBP1A family penicillin-binding protein [Hydrogenibacillus schlegelii]
MRRFFGIARGIARLIGLAGLGLAGVVVFLYVNTGPLPPPERPGIDWRFRDGTPLPGGDAPVEVPLAAISPALIEATLAVEDRRFYRHFGLDPIRIAGALVHNLRAGRLMEGGSTITQQLARNAYLSHERTWSRKLREAVLALKLERTLTKEAILERYLNTIYYGNGAYGVEAAARLYFGKSAADLTLPEAALLAGIPKGPALYEPFAHPEAALARRREVLRAMVDAGTLSPEEAARAAEAPLALVRRKPAPDLYGYAREAAVRFLEAELGLPRAVQPYAGLTVTLTLDPKAMQAAEAALARRLPAGDADGLTAAIVAADPADGGIRALVGGRDFRTEPFDRTAARRPPGSAFKPIVYLAALEAGMTPLSVVDSKPTVFVYDGGRTYAPKNYGDRYYGPITMLRAVKRSDNIYAVSALMAAGAEAVVRRAHDLGIRSPLPAVPALALGAQGVTPLELAEAYTTLAAGGLHAPLHLVERVETKDGRVLYEARPKREPAADPATVFVLTRLLEGVFDVGETPEAMGTAALIAADIRRPVAGKSGTTATDAWMAGYTPDLAVVVWVGRDDARPIDDRIAGPVAKHLFADVLEGALRDVPPHLFPIPDGVAAAYVDEASGRATCGRGTLVYFVRGTEPPAPCGLAAGSGPAEREGRPPAPPAERRASLIDRLRQLFGDPISGR